MANTTNLNLSISLNATTANCLITFRLQLNDHERDMLQVGGSNTGILEAEVQFKGDDGGAFQRGDDDTLGAAHRFRLTQVSPANTGSHPPASSQIEVRASVPRSVLNEDKGWGASKKKRRKRDRDEVYANVRLLFTERASAFPRPITEYVSTNVVTGMRF